MLNEQRNGESSRDKRPRHQDGQRGLAAGSEGIRVFDVADESQN